MTDGDIVLSVDLNAEDAIATSDSLTEDLRQIFDGVSGSNTSAAFKRLQMEMDKAVTASQLLRDRLIDLENSTFPTEEYAEVSNQLDAIVERYQALDLKRKQLEAAGKIDTSQYKELEVALNAVYEKMELLRDAKDSMEANGTAFIGGEETQEYDDTVQKLNQVNNQMVILKQQALEFGEEGEESATRVNTGYSRVQSTTSSLNKTMSTLVSALKKAGDAVKKLGASAISAGIEKLKSKFTGLSKSSDDASKSFEKGFKLLIKYAFGVRSFFFLYRKIRKAITEGFGDLAQVYEPFNSAMSEIMTSLSLLKNTIAAAFAPLVEVVAPILSQFINQLAEAISKVGQFIAAMTGKEYVQAGTAYIDYAKSLDKSSKSSSKATKQTKDQTEAQKKLNREITHFDDLVILHDKHEKESTTPSSNTSPSTATFAPMPIGDAISQFAKDFKAAWAKADFTDIGRQLGEKLKTTLENLPWEKIQAGTRKIAKSIATFLNGFLETPGLFTEIGTTVGEAINTALAGLSTFAWEFHWGSLGTAVGDAIYAALDTVNWDDAFSAAEGFGTGLADFLNGILNTPGLFEKIGTTVGNLINTRLAALNSFAWEFEWDKLGEAVQTTIISALDTINWPLVHSTVKGFAKGLAEFLNNLFTPDTFNAIGNTVAELLLTALDFLNTFGETFGWEDFGNSLASGLNTFLIKFTANDGPAKFGKGVYTFVVGIKNAIITWLDKVNWYSFGTTLRDIIQNLPWTTLLKSFGEIIWHAIKAVINLAKGIFTDGTVGDPVVKAFEKLQTAVDNITKDVNFDEIATAFGNVVNALKPATEGFAVGFLDVFTKLAEIGNEFLKNLGPALQAIADALNSMDPELLKTIGSDLGKIAAAFVIFKSVSGIFETVAGLFTTVAGTASGISTATSALGGLFGKMLGGLGVTSVLHENFKMINQEQERTARQSESSAQAFETIGDAMIQAGYGGDMLESSLLNTLQAYILNGDELPDLQSALQTAGQEFVDQGGNIEDFATQLQKSVDAGEFGENADVVQDYINKIGEKAVTAGKDTGTLSGAFDAFEGLSIWTPIKMALIGAAIKSMGEKGLLSDEQVDGLLKTMDGADDSNITSVLDDVETALSDAGIEAGDFNTAMSTAFGELEPSVQGSLKTAIQTIENSGDDIQKQTLETFKNFGLGAASGIEESTSYVKDASGAMALAGYGAVDEKLEINSPSKVLKQRGEWFAEGFRLGIVSSTAKVVGAAKDLVTQTVSKFDGLKDSLKTKGSDAMIGLYNGINSESTNLYNLARDIADDIYDGFDDQGWRTLGSNIGVGIYNGLIAESSSLETLAWNTAVDMYNAACDALDIASPSKKFAWIGKMLMQGWQNGIADNSDSAVDAVSDVAGAMTDEAEDMNPAITISTSVEHWIDALNSVLTDFSDTIVNRFDNLINTLVGLSNVSVGLPAIAQGKVIPSSITSAAHSSADASEMKNMLESLVSQQITYDDLRAMLVEVARDYMQTNFYLGDEQIARHANNGNLLLNRRYSTMKA